MIAVALIPNPVPWLSPLSVSIPLNASPNRLTARWDYQVGCDQAEFEIDGPELNWAIESIKKWIFSAVDIYWGGDAIWQGFVSRIEIETARGEFRGVVTWENFATRVVLQYNDPISSDVKMKTGISSLYSLGVQVDRIVKMGYLSDADAQTTANQLAAMYSRIPFVTQMEEGTNAPAYTRTRLRFVCLGWWHLMNRKAYVYSSSTPTSLATELHIAQAGSQVYGAKFIVPRSAARAWLGVDNPKSFPRNSPGALYWAEFIERVLEAGVFLGSGSNAGKIYMPVLQFYPNLAGDIFYIRPNDMPRLLFTPAVGLVREAGWLPTLSMVVDNGAYLDPRFVRLGHVVQLTTAESGGPAVLTSAEYTWPENMLRFSTSLAMDFITRVLRDRRF